MKAVTPLALAAFGFAAFGLAATFAPLAAGAQAKPAPQRVLSRGVPAAVQRVAPKSRASSLPGQRQGQRRWVGTIQSIGSNSFTVSRRNGKTGTVDDTAALANGTYSAPLFIGKIVIIIGSYDTTSHIMYADTITRMTYYDPGTPSETTP